MINEKGDFEPKVCDWCHLGTPRIEWTIHRFHVRPRAPVYSEILPIALIFCNDCFPRVYNDSARYANDGISADNRYRIVFIVLGFFFASIFIFLEGLLVNVTIQDSTNEIFLAGFFISLVLIPISIISAFIPIFGLRRASLIMDMLFNGKMHENSSTPPAKYTGSLLWITICLGSLFALDPLFCFQYFQLLVCS